jgi:hypothetical protein
MRRKHDPLLRVQKFLIEPLANKRLHLQKFRVNKDSGSMIVFVSKKKPNQRNTRKKTRPGVALLNKAIKS